VYWLKYSVEKSFIVLDFVLLFGYCRGLRRTGAIVGWVKRCTDTDRKFDLLTAKPSPSAPQLIYLFLDANAVKILVVFRKWRQDRA